MKARKQVLPFFKAKKLDILIGTQMIAKGLHFPNVTLVGILNADIGLHVRRHAERLDVFTTSLKTGEAIRGVELTLIDDHGKSLGQATSGTEGHAALSAAGCTGVVAALSR